MTDIPEGAFRMLCLACGGPIGDKHDDEDEERVRKRFRTFSFGPSEQEVQISLVAMVCPKCVDVDMFALRRIVYSLVFQAREWESSPMRLESHE